MSIEQVQEAIKKALSRIAPAWPLENSVAVNPFLGLSDLSFDEAAELLKHRGDVNLFMPISFYQHMIDRGEIQNSDIRLALSKKEKDQSVREFRNNLNNIDSSESEQFVTLSDYATSYLELPVDEYLVNHVSEWLSSYFAQTRNTSQIEDMFSTWKNYGQTDLTPELNGLTGFREAIKSVPNQADAAILKGLENLHIPEHLVEVYLHSTLLKLIGWSSYCSGIDWQNNLYGDRSSALNSLLAIILSWENAVISTHPELDQAWVIILNQYSGVKHRLDQNYLEAQSILQEAFDLSFQRKLANKLNSAGQTYDLTKSERSLAQMVFCIDVRSEVYRRNLESVDPSIETFGFAGFFGFPIKYSPLNHQHGKNQCPVLIPSGHHVQESTHNEVDLHKVTDSIIKKGKLSEAWSKFKSGPVSSYSFVSPLGLFYLPKLITDSFGLTTPVPNPKKREFGHVLSGKRKLDISSIPFEDQLTMAKSALTTMGLTENFARLVLITGHGSTSVNNPHASGLDCGACGGNSGEINALTAQAILNDREIRIALRESGILIPKDAFFLACIHDTTTDEVDILNEEQVPASHMRDLEKVKTSLSLASKKARENRAPRLGIQKKSADKSVVNRSKDWSQVRPEWGLAGCSAFIVAPRKRTLGIDLEGKSFLHSYDWKADEDFSVLETIMTAPMVVTSWINLQYYASTVDNLKLGAGNKTLHNVTAGIGVLEGSTGDLRIGLPIQSVHDGKNYQHLPLRLNVIIEAPIDAVNRILAKHANLRELVDNNWINLMLMDEQGQVKFHYDRALEWGHINELETKEKVLETL